MGTAGFKYSWKKMEAAAEDRTGWRKVVCGMHSTGSDKAEDKEVKSSSLRLRAAYFYLLGKRMFEKRKEHITEKEHITIDYEDRSIETNEQLA